LMATAVSMVVLRNCSTPASPSTRRKRPICVASQDSLCWYLPAQYHHRVAQIDHRVQAGAEEVVGGHRWGLQNSHKPISIGIVPGSSFHRQSPRIASRLLKNYSGGPQPMKPRYRQAPVPTSYPGPSLGTSPQPRPPDSLPSLRAGCQAGSSTAC
jgi:hypothetical protein